MKMERYREAIRNWGAVALVIVLGIVAAFISLSDSPSAESRLRQSTQDEFELEAEGDFPEETPYTSYRGNDFRYSGGSAPDFSEPTPGTKIDLNITTPLNPMSAGTNVPDPNAVFVFSGSSTQTSPWLAKRRMRLTGSGKPLV